MRRLPRKLFAKVELFAFFLACCALATSGAVAEPTFRAQKRIANGLNTGDFPTTGQLIHVSESGGYRDCSGTLVGCKTFLTAAHCIDQDLNPGSYWVYLQNAGVMAVESLHPHPEHQGFEGTDVADIAVVKLSEPVTGIEPTSLIDFDPTTLLSNGGSIPGTIAGFGRSSNNTHDGGVKRWGKVSIEECRPSDQHLDGDLSPSLCWSSAGGFPAGENAATCPGDSGGPLFYQDAILSVPVLAGVHNTGGAYTCAETSYPSDASVYEYLDFIQPYLTGDSTTVCGGFPAVGSSPSAQSITYQGTFDGPYQSTSISIEVRPDTERLLITLNGGNALGYFKIDPYVSGVSLGRSFCHDTGTGPSYCEFSTPNVHAGEWYLLFGSILGFGGGDYQLTVTTFLSAVPEPTTALLQLTALLTLLTIRRRQR